MIRALFVLSAIVAVASAFVAPVNHAAGELIKTPNDCRRLDQVIGTSYPYLSLLGLGRRASVVFETPILGLMAMPRSS